VIHTSVVVNRYSPAPRRATWRMVRYRRAYRDGAVGCDHMTRPGTSSVAVLVMARTMQRIAAKYPDDDPTTQRGNRYDHCYLNPVRQLFRWIAIG